MSRRLDRGDAVRIGKIVQLSNVNEQVDEMKRLCEEAEDAKSDAHHTLAICATLATLGAVVWRVSIEVCRRLEAKP